MIRAAAEELIPWEEVHMQQALKEVQAADFARGSAAAVLKKFREKKLIGLSKTTFFDRVKKLQSTGVASGGPGRPFSLDHVSLMTLKDSVLNHQHLLQPIPVRKIQKMMRLLRALKLGDAEFVDDDDDSVSESDCYDEDNTQDDAHALSKRWDSSRVEMTGDLGFGVAVNGETLSDFLGNQSKTKLCKTYSKWPSMRTVKRWLKTEGLTAKKPERLDAARSAASTTETYLTLLNGFNQCFSALDIHDQDQLLNFDETRFAIEFQQAAQSLVAVGKGSHSATSTNLRSPMIKGLSLAPLVTMSGKHVMTLVIGKGTGVTNCFKGIKDCDFKRRIVTENSESGYLNGDVMKRVMYHMLHRIYLLDGQDAPSFNSPLETWPVLSKHYIILMDNNSSHLSATEDIQFYKFFVTRKLHVKYYLPNLTHAFQVKFKQN